jgi:hypothetical protein
LSIGSEQMKAKIINRVKMIRLAVIREGRSGTSTSR